METQELLTTKISKTRVMTIRVEPALFSVLEKLTEKWNSAGISDTVRTILSMYLLPAVYEVEWKKLKPSELQEMLNEQNEKGYSFKLARFNRFMEEVVEYMAFLKEAQVMGNKSIHCVEITLSDLEKIVQEMETRLMGVLMENKKNM